MPGGQAAPTRPRLAFPAAPTYISVMQHRFANATTTTTPGFPGAAGLRVIA